MRCTYPVVSLRFVRKAAVPRTPPDEFSMLTERVSNAVVVVVSSDVMLYQKLRGADVALEGIVTI